jgi:hypothetical protein
MIEDLYEVYIDAMLTTLKVNKPEKGEIKIIIKYEDGNMINLKTVREEES